LRQSTLDPASSKWATRLAFRLGARLSHHLPESIVCCSHAGLELHVRRGYDAARMVLIPNGFDLELLKPDGAAPAALRAEFAVAPGTPLIGLVARWDPQKDHRTFAAAAAALTASPPPHFVLCGEGVTPGNAELAGWIAAHGLSERFHLLGRRDNIPALMAGLDVLTSASYQEGFSNVIGEAMACGVPCVVTDAGDSARIVGDTGYVVTPRDPAAIAAAWESLLGQSLAAREELGLRARQRIAGEYSIGRIARMYADLYAAVACSSARAPAANGESTLPAAL
jgi:glycosyltransferase involved in cell wall biosynthesis